MKTPILQYSDNSFHPKNWVSDILGSIIWKFLYQGKFKKLCIDSK